MRLRNLGSMSRKAVWRSTTWESAEISDFGSILFPCWFYLLGAAWNRGMGLSIRREAGHEAAPPVAGGGSIVYINAMPKQAARQNRSLLILMVAMMAIVAVAVVVMWRI